MAYIPFFDHSEVNMDFNLIFKEGVLHPEVMLKEIEDTIISEEKNIIDACSSINTLENKLTRLLYNKHSIIFAHLPIDDDKDSVGMGNFDGEKNLEIIIVLFQNAQEKCISNFKDFSNDVFSHIGHELVHRIQYIVSKGKNTTWVKSLSKKALSNNKELMSYAWQIIQVWKAQGLSNHDIIKLINSEVKGDSENKLENMALKFKSNTYMYFYYFHFANSDKAMKQLYKYIFQYLDA